MYFRLPLQFSIDPSFENIVNLIRSIKSIHVNDPLPPTNFHKSLELIIQAFTNQSFNNSTRYNKNSLNFSNC